MGKTVMLFKMGQVARVDLPFAFIEMIGNRTLLSVNDELLIKTAQARTPEGDIILLVRPVVEIPGLLEGEAAIKGEREQARMHGAGWLDRRAAPLKAIWESEEDTNASRS